MLFEMAVADSYCIPFEFVDDPESHGLVNDLATYQQHPRYDGLKPSQFTDDTQRSIANAKVVLAYNWHDPCAYVRAMQEEFCRDPRDGYSHRFQTFMEENTSTYPLDWLRAIPIRKESNGSIMGAAPLGYLFDPVEVRLAANLQAMTTHSIATAPFAQTIALASHYFIYELGEREDLLGFLFEEVEGVDQALGDIVLGGDYPKGPVKMTARDTCHAVLGLLKRCNSLTEIIKAAVDLRGDTDSVAALSVAIASTSKDYEDDLPQSLKEGLEFGNTVQHSRLLNLDIDLAARANYEKARG